MCPYSLQIKGIPYKQRLKPKLLCKLIHYKSGLTIPGSFTYSESVEILKKSRDWDFTLLNRTPLCADKLKILLESICNRNDKQDPRFSKSLNCGNHQFNLNNTRII